MRRATQCHGVLAVDKPSGMTSHDVVDEIRRIVGQKAVGHAGTLDPAAEGLLVLLLGRATKIARFLSGADKVYSAEVTLGLESPTYDAEGIQSGQTPAPVPELSREDIESLLDSFRGRIVQKVPPFSAVQVDGERLYKRARKGEETTVPEREVEIKLLRPVSFDGSRLALEITCSSGTYIRSLAHDIGQKVGCGAYLSHLRRTASGRLGVEDAVSLENLRACDRDELVNKYLLPIERVLEFSSVVISDEFKPRILDGCRPGASDIVSAMGSFAAGDRILVKDSAGKILAVGVARLSSGQLHAGPSTEVLKYDRVLA